MFHIEDHVIETIEDLEIAFDAYCNWCWGHGYGSCEICLKNKLEYLNTLKSE
jgi:hypothetical protein